MDTYVQPLIDGAEVIVTLTPELIAIFPYHCRKWRLVCRDNPAINGIDVWWFKSPAPVDPQVTTDPAVLWVRQHVDDGHAAFLMDLVFITGDRLKIYQSWPSIAGSYDKVSQLVQLNSIICDLITDFTNSLQSGNWRSDTCLPPWLSAGSEDTQSFYRRLRQLPSTN